MRRSRRIYKRKSRSNMETLIILIGAIIILSVAFYMAREKSFLPPEENKAVQQNTFEDEKAEMESEEQRSLDELLAQSRTNGERQEETGTEFPKKGQEEENLSQQETERESLNESSPHLAQDFAQQSNDTIGSITTEEIQIEEGKNSTVITEQPVISGSAYTVQVGYFSVESNARGLASEIENHGFRTFILKKNDAYKVQVGAYAEREEAEKASQTLKNLGYEIWVTQR